MFDYLETDTVFVMTSDLASKRFYPKQVQHSNVKDTKANEIVLDENETFQEILGFGGAFTDSAGYNINLMGDDSIKRKIIEAYYEPKNLDYSLGRTNLGGCDFSTRYAHCCYLNLNSFSDSINFFSRPYTYVDTEGDVNLETFALQDEDIVDKVYKFNQFYFFVWNMITYHFRYHLLKWQWK